MDAVKKGGVAPGVRGGLRRAWLSLSMYVATVLLCCVIGQAFAAGIAAGFSHSLWIKDDATLWAWGDNFDGQLGDGTKVDRSSPVKLFGIANVAGVAAGDSYTVAVRTDGAVLAWGLNDHGQLGDGTTSLRTLPAVVGGVTGVAQVAAGLAHAVALKKDGTVWAWGANESGELGDGTLLDRKLPVAASGLTSVTAIGAGHYHTLAVRSDGTVWSWGDNDNGQLGDGTTTTRQAPVKVSGLSNVVEVRGGVAHSLARRSDGTVWAWGANFDGQLGIGNQIQKTVPVQVPGLTHVARIAAGYSFSVALKDDGSVWVWGYNGLGELGTGSSSGSFSPVPITAITGVVGIATGSEHLLLLRNDGSIWASGENLTGQLGDGSTVMRPAPLPMTGVTGVTAVVAGGSHTLALRSDGTAWAWGYNAWGQLGDGTETSRGAPVRVGPSSGSGQLTGVLQLAGGYRHSLAVKTDGTLWSWGNNDLGQLGGGADGDQDLPAPVAGLTGIRSVAAGLLHSIALKSDGTVWTWGANNHGQVGDGTTTNRLTPFKVPGLANVVAVAASGFHSLALLADGSVRAWGYNARGQLGDGTTTDRLAPVAVSGLAGVTAIAAGGTHSAALKADKTVWTWGDNVTGQLGNGTTVQRTTPGAAAGAANVTAISAGGFATFALRADGAVLTWGRGGMTGDTGEADALFPKVLMYLRGLAMVSSNLDHTVALTTDGRMFGWGSNLGQELGIVYPQFSRSLVRVKDTQSSRVTTSSAPTGMSPSMRVLPKAAVGSFESADLVIEYFNATIKNGAGTSGIGHYFLTAVPEEAASIDSGGSGPGWQRTGRTFRAWNVKANAPANAVGVCRFYARGPNSHFYTAGAGECQSLRDQNPTNDPNLGWSYEGIAFYTVLTVGGQCTAGYYPIYRSYNNRFSPIAALNDGNHRITPSYNDNQRSVRFLGFIDEGIVFCAPASADAGADLQTTYSYPGTEAVAGSTVQAQYIYNNNGPGKGDGGTIYMALPANVTNWVVTCTARFGATCPASLDANRLREGQTIATWPAGGGLVLNATGTAPAAPAGTSTTMDFATTSARGNGSPDPTPENDSPPPAQTVVRGTSTCNYTLNPGNLSFGPGPQTLPVTMISRAACNWTATSDSQWLSVTAPSGTGNATLQVSVLANPASQPRTGSVTVNGTSLFVVQAGASAPNAAGACSNLHLQREGDPIPARGLTGATSVAVFAERQCAWSAQADAPWVAVTAGGGGSGNGTLSYVAQPNTDGDARSATITVGEKRFVVNQLGTKSDSGSGGSDGGSDGGGDSGGASGGDSGGSSGGDSG